MKVFITNRPTISQEQDDRIYEYLSHSINKLSVNKNFIQSNSHLIVAGSWWVDDGGGRFEDVSVCFRITASSADEYGERT